MRKCLLFLFVFIIQACSPDKTSSNEALSVLSDFQELDIEYFGRNFEIETVLPIETNDNSLISGVKKVVTYKDKVILFCDIEKKIFILDSNTGNIVNTIFRRGNGPGESNVIIDIAFDESSEHILIYNDYYKLLFYDMQGEFLGEEKVGDHYGNMTCDNGEVIFYNKSEGYSCYPYRLKIFNSKNKVWREIGNDKKIDFPIRSQGLQMVKSKRTWFTAPLDFETRIFENNEIKTPYRIDIPISGLNESLIEKSISDPTGFFIEISMGNIIYNINSVRETEKHLVFRSNHGDIFLINKSDEKIYWRKNKGNSFANISLENYYPHEGDDNRIMFIIPAEKWTERNITFFADMSNSIKEKLNQMEINEDDNPILVFFKEKIKTGYE